MPGDRCNELHDFHRCLGETLSNGMAAMSPEEALDRWRDAHPSHDEYANTVAALREALADMDRGETGRPLDEFARAFQAKHSLPPRS